MRADRPSRAGYASCCAPRWSTRASACSPPSGGTSTTRAGSSTRSSTCRSSASDVRESPGSAILARAAPTTLQLEANVTKPAAVALTLGLALAGPAFPADAQVKARFDALLDEAWELDKKENPLQATATGDHRYNDRLPSVAPADLERRAAATRAPRGRPQATDTRA